MRTIRSLTFLCMASLTACASNPSTRIVVNGLDVSEKPAGISPWLIGGGVIAVALAASVAVASRGGNNSSITTIPDACGNGTLPPADPRCVALIRPGE